MIGPRDLGERVHTPAGVDGIAVRIRTVDDEGNRVVDVELDGHTYGPGMPAHTFPIGTVWRDAPAEPAGPSWFPMAGTPDTQPTAQVPRITPADAPERVYGADWWDDTSAAETLERIRRERRDPSS